MATASNDRELWDRLRRGDARAFEGFYLEHAPRLRNFLRRHVGDPKVVEDIAQEAFLELWRHPNGFDPTRARLKTYVFGIAVKRAADWWRHAGRNEGRVVRDPDNTESERSVLIGDALARLGPEPRSLLWLREVEGYSYAELAEIFGVPVGTVKSRLFAAREQLRAIWKGEE